MIDLSSLPAVFSHPTAQAAAFIVVCILAIGLAMRLLRRAIRSRVADNELRYRASKLVTLGGYSVIIIVVLTVVGGRLSGFTVALGAGSAGIAFALQEVIASFAGWLAVSFGGFYKVGDRVQLGGIKGDVIDIGFIRTTIMEIGSWVNGDLYNGRIVRVANSFIFKEPVFNYSGEFPFVWDEIVVPIKFGSDYDLVRAILTQAADDVVGDYVASAREHWQRLVKSFRIEDARIDPLVTIIANDNWVEFTLRYVVEHRARRITKDKLFTQLLREVEANKARVGMASMTVHLVEAPAFDVRLTGQNGAPPLATAAKLPEGAG